MSQATLSPWCHPVSHHYESMWVTTMSHFTKQAQISTSKSMHTTCPSADSSCDVRLGSLCCEGGGPVTEVADNFAWAQEFFGNSCRRNWMGPVISSQKWPMILYGPRISSVSPAEASGWAHWSFHRSGHWFRMGPYLFCWALLKQLLFKVSIKFSRLLLWM